MTLGPWRNGQLELSVPRISFMSNSQSGVWFAGSSQFLCGHITLFQVKLSCPPVRRWINCWHQRCPSGAPHFHLSSTHRHFFSSDPSKEKTAPWDEVQRLDHNYDSAGNLPQTRTTHLCEEEVGKNKERKDSKKKKKPCSATNTFNTDKHCPISVYAHW